MENDCVESSSGNGSTKDSNVYDNEQTDGFGKETNTKLQIKDIGDRTIKHKKGVWLTIGIAVCAVCAVMLMIALVSKSSIYSINDEKEIIRSIINEKYSSYEIVDIKLTYTNFFSTVTEADEEHSATDAVVIIAKNDEQKTIRLGKSSSLFGPGWIIKSDYPDYGSGVPDDVYFVEIEYDSVGKAVDIDKYVNEHWILPDKDGNLYTKSGTRDWYYSLKECKNIYKTKNGQVYSFDKEKSDWTDSSVLYSDLNYYGNYDKVAKEYAISIIEQFSSYRE